MKVEKIYLTLSSVSPSRTEDRKCYGQVCTVARALDLIGDRWTLLVLRELLGGPARFHELQAGLPGIAKNLLTDRLRRLEGDGIVRRVSMASSTRYAVTELGAATRPVVEALGLWGAKAPKIAPLEHDRSLRSIAVALQTILGRAGDTLPSERIVLELEIDEEPLEVVLGPRPLVTVRPCREPDARLRTTRAAMKSFLQGQGFDPERVALVSGDDAARSALLRTMGAML